MDSTKKRRSHRDLFLTLENILFALMFAFFAYENFRYVLTWHGWGTLRLYVSRRDISYDTGTQMFAAIRAIETSQHFLPLARTLQLFLFTIFNSFVMMSFLTRMKPMSDHATTKTRRYLIEMLFPVLSTLSPLLYNVIPINQEPTLNLIFLAWILSLIGIAIGSLAVYHLRRSFAIFIDVRGIVTRGLYRYIRHPLYLGEILVILGVALSVGNTPAFLLFLLHTTGLLIRAHLEERKLAAHSEEYRSYMEKSSAFLPGIY